MKKFLLLFSALLVLGCSSNEPANKPTSKPTANKTYQSDNILAILIKNSQFGFISFNDIIMMDEQERNWILKIHRAGGYEAYKKNSVIAYKLQDNYFAEPTTENLVAVLSFMKKNHLEIATVTDDIFDIEVIAKFLRKKEYDKGGIDQMFRLPGINAGYQEVHAHRLNLENTYFAESTPANLDRVLQHYQTFRLSMPTNNGETKDLAVIRSILTQINN